MAKTRTAVIDSIEGATRNLTALTAVEIREMKAPNLRKLARANGLDEKGLKMGEVADNVFKARLSESRKLGHVSRKHVASQKVVEATE